MSSLSPTLRNQQIIPSILVIDVWTLGHLSCCTRPDIPSPSEKLSSGNINFRLPYHRRWILIISIDPAPLDINLPVLIEEETWVYTMKIEVDKLAIGIGSERSVAVIMEFDE